MIDETRRRAYLDAMQVNSWVPRTELPFAAPSRPELLAVLEAPQAAALPLMAERVSPVADVPIPPKPASAVVERPKIEVPRPTVVSRMAAKPQTDDSEAEAPPVKVAAVPVPRFSLQLLRAGSCLLLVELATGESFQSRDPSYLLLKDLLRAAGLPDSPQIIGEPVRWPLLTRGNMTQGPDAARDFVQGFLSAQLEGAPCQCIWLIGLPAIRFGGEGQAEDYDREWQVEGLGNAWALPSLELLMDEPARKASLWQAMRKLMPRWKAAE